jgi:hypothetical protein
LLDAAKFSLCKKNCAIGGLPDIGRPAEISAFAAPASCMFFLLTAVVFAFILLNKHRCAKSSVRGWIRHVNIAVPPVIIAEAVISSAQNAASVAATFLSRKLNLRPLRRASFFLPYLPGLFAGVLMAAVSALSGQVKRFSAHERQRLAGTLEGR